jgi:small subunit ribosomal protein S9
MAQIKEKVSSLNASPTAPVAHGVGRRKKTVARVWLRKGNGKMVVNGRPYEEYFDTEYTRLNVTTPFRVCEQFKNYDVSANITGGGVCAQSDAIKLGIARAIVSIDESARLELRKHGLLTVDSRVKERKKYGQKAARRKFQFVTR